MDANGSRLPIIEALILSSAEPLSVSKMRDVMEGLTPADVEDTISRLNEKYRAGDFSFRIRKIAGGYQVYILEDYSGYVAELFTRRRQQRLSRAALETLAIIAYRQPVTKGDIELIRGVASDSAVHTLLERKLITLAGRARSLGRPLLYRTTDEFLKFFDLDSLDDLPKMEEIEELLASDDSDAQQILKLLPAETREKFGFESGEAEDSSDEDIGDGEPADAPGVSGHAVTVPVSRESDPLSSQEDGGERVAETEEEDADGAEPPVKLGEEIIDKD
jgi:segregation and condensation protein B